MSDEYAGLTDRQLEGLADDAFQWRDWETYQWIQEELIRRSERENDELVPDEE